MWPVAAAWGGEGDIGLERPAGISQAMHAVPKARPGQASHHAEVRRRSGPSPSVDPAPTSIFQVASFCVCCATCGAVCRCGWWVGVSTFVNVAGLGLGYMCERVCPGLCVFAMSHGV